MNGKRLIRATIRAERAGAAQWLRDHKRLLPRAVHPLTVDVLRALFHGRGWKPSEIAAVIDRLSADDVRRPLFEMYRTRREIEYPLLYAKRDTIRFAAENRTRLPRVR